MNDMITTVQPQTKEISTVDALWTLIQGQSKRVRQANIHTRTVWPLPLKEKARAVVRV